MSTARLENSSIVNKALIISAYGAIVALPLLAAGTTSGWADRDVVARSAEAFVLVAFGMACLQPVLAARIKLLDRAFGLDIVYVLHKTLGMTAAFVQACALSLRVVGHERPLPWSSMAGTGLVLALVLSALLHRELHLTYEAWRKLHNALFIGFIIALFVDALSVTVPLRSFLSVSSVIFLFLIALTAYCLHRLIGPALRRRLLFRVESVTQETKNVWTLTLSPPQGTERFEFLPGQFQFLTFNEGRGEEHPFTISSSPAQQGSHSATIKGSGDFTRTIGSLKAGDRVAVQAPFGRFSHALHPAERDLVFIAGGIGITPFMSMLRSMRDNAEDRNVLLLYANNTEEDIAFRQELDLLASGATPRLRTIHVLGKAGSDWSGERGFIDRDRIMRSVPGDFKAKTYYLCGPPPMMAALIAVLMELGVPSNHIRSERFAL